MKRLLRCLLCILLLLPALALAADAPDPFTGYFTENVHIRPAPQPGSETLGHIPANTAVDLTPVDDRYARVTYNGRTGYVYYAQVRRMPAEKKVTPYLAYLPENKYLFSTPLDGSPALLTVQAETPVTVTAEVGRFLHITAHGKEGYVYAYDAEAIDDMYMEPTDAEFFAEAAVKTRQYPLKNAAQTLSLEPNRVYMAEAVCNGYYRVTIGEDTVYVPTRSVTALKRQQQTVRAALITPETPLFTRPDQAHRADPALESTQLMLLDPQENGFQRVQALGLYVRANDVTAYAVSIADGQRLHIQQDAPLLLEPEKGAQETAAVRKGQLYIAEYATEDWYLLQSEGKWGFLRKDDRVAAVLLTDMRMSSTAAVLEEAAVLYGVDGHAHDMPAGTRLLLTEGAGDFYRAKAGAQEGFLPKAAVRILGTDTELTAYTIAAPEQIAVMDFPDAALSRTAFTIPKGAKLRVTGFNRCYLIVAYNGKTGYAPQTGLLTAESEGLPTTEDVPAYGLVLDKSTLMAYAFVLDEQGEYGELVICAEVGIGKRTTPTPSGAFTLGQKERWHAFTLSYTPHTTEYVKARYIHGWPCDRKDEDTVKESLVRTGTVTGGCLRSPFEFARWVYMNCPSYLTQLTVVSGGFEAPAAAADKLVK